MGAHTGRCFRAWRRYVARNAARGVRIEFPIRQKVPQALRPFLNAVSGSQRRATAEPMKLAITKYAQHQAMIGHRAQSR